MFHWEGAGGGIFFCRSTFGIVEEIAIAELFFFFSFSEIKLQKEISLTTRWEGKFSEPSSNEAS